MYVGFRILSAFSLWFAGPPGSQEDQRARCAHFILCPREWLHFSKTARRHLLHISCCRHIGEFRVEGGVSMKGRNQHVTKRSDGNWQVKGEGASRASFVTTTQSEAIKLGRRICSNQESELIIHRCDGRIRARDSHGHDPYPPRG